MMTPTDRAPEGLLLEARIVSLRSLIAAIDANIESVRLRSLLPADPRAILIGLGIDPRAAERLEGELPLTILSFDRGASTERAVGVRLDGAGIARLRRALPFEAVDGIHRLEGSSPAPLFLVGDRLIMARSAAFALELAPYLAREMTEEDDGDDEDEGETILRLCLRSPAQLAGLRELLDRAVERRMDALRAAMMARRAALPDEPALGDPEAAIDSLERRLRLALSLSAHLKTVEMTMRAHEGSATFRILFEANEGSELDAIFNNEAGKEREGGLGKILARGAAGAGFGIAFYGDRALNQLLLTAGGEQISGAERARIEALFSREGAEDRARFIAARAIGGAGELLILREGEDAERLKRAIEARSSYLRALMIRIAGCDAEGAPGSGGRGELCRGEGARTRLEAAGDALYLRTARPSSDSAGRLGKITPELARLFSAIDDQASLAIYLEGERLLPSLALSSRRVELAILGARASPPRPAFITYQARSGGGELRIALAPSSIDRLLRALLTLRNAEDHAP